MPVIEKVEIFAVGRHNGVKFTEKDLDELVSNYEETKGTLKIPLKIGHNEKQPLTDGQPAIGFVEKIWRQGDKLLGKFIDVPAIVFDAIKKKLFRTVSVELAFMDEVGGKKFNQLLTGVAILGADLPAVESLKDLQAFMNRGVKFANRKTFFSKRKKEGLKMTDEEILALQKKASDLADENKKLISSNHELDGKVHKFSTDEDARKATDKVEKIKLARSAVIEILDKAVKDEKITPAKRELFSKTLNVDNDDLVININLDSVKELVGEEKTAKFSKEDKSKSKKKDETAPDKAAVKAVYKLMGENSSLSFSEARRRVFKVDDELAKDYANQVGVA